MASNEAKITKLQLAEVWLLKQVCVMPKDFDSPMLWTRPIKDIYLSYYDMVGADAAVTIKDFVDAVISLKLPVGRINDEAVTSGWVWKRNVTKRMLGINSQ